MQLQDYFTILAHDDIRIKGTRIGIESVLYEYITEVKLLRRLQSSSTLLRWSKSMPRFCIT
jgi:hypothetical protein